MYERLLLKYAANPRVIINNVGLADRADTKPVSVSAGTGEMSGGWVEGVGGRMPQVWLMWETQHVGAGGCSKRLLLYFTGLYDNFRGSKTWDGNSTITTLSLSEYVASNKLEGSVCMTFIDVEGYEAKARTHCSTCLDHLAGGLA